MKLQLEIKPHAGKGGWYIRITSGGEAYSHIANTKPGIFRAVLIGVGFLMRKRGFQ